MIGEQISHYKIIRKLGEGGMGEVYLAEDTELERKVALKFLPPHYSADSEILARFKHEAKAAAALNHPNIVTVYEVGDHEGRPYIAMAYVAGDLLTDLIAAKDMPVDKALNIVEQLCDGLGKAHEAGIVHRDIKPDNIFVDSDSRVKILDFGLATQQGVTRVTKEESTLGTLYYMSPEQTQADEADKRSDIFSVGVVLYEMIAGQPPFRGEHSAAVLYAIANDTQQPLSRYNSKVTPELERIVAKALAKDPRDRYQSVADFSVDLKHAYDRPGAVSGSGRSVLKFAIPASVVFLAIIAFLIFKPFRVDISSDQPAEAAGNKLAIMYFENIAQPDDPRRLGEIVTDLLITNLSRTEALQVVSSQRLYDILKLKGHEGEKVIDRSTSTEVARDAGAKWMMQGRILQVEPYIISSQLMDMNTGNIVTSQRVTGAPGETIFEIVDRMTGETKGELQIPVQRSAEAAVSVADVTTNSLEAYAFYLEGEEYANRLFRPEAREAYSRAVEADSTFAMAWLKMAAYSFPDFAAVRFAVKKAVKYADQATEKEQLYIRGMDAVTQLKNTEAEGIYEELVERYPEEKDALLSLGNHYYQREMDEDAIRAYEAVVALDPMYKLAYNQLAYAFDRTDNFEKSIWAINKYIELAPDEPNPYDSRGDLYAYAGHVDEAIESYAKAAEIKSDFYPSVSKLGDMYLFKLEDAKAEEQYRKLVTSNDPAVRSGGRFNLANILLYRGRMQLGLAQLEAALSADEMEGFQGFEYVGKFFAIASVYTELEEYEKSLQTMERARPVMNAIVPPQFQPFVDMGFAMGLAVNERVDEAKAAMAELEPVLARMPMQGTLQKDYLTTHGVIAFEGGDFAEACDLLARADSIENDFNTRFMLADALLEAGRTEEAVELLEKMLERHSPSRMQSSLFAVKSHYKLGLAYERTGATQKAIEQYRRYLTIYENADDTLEEITNARDRLAALDVSG